MSTFHSCDLCKNPNEEITIWERLNHKTNEWKHNHIEEGWSSLDAPLPQNQKQAKDWKGASWRKHYGYLKEGRVNNNEKVTVHFNS